MTPPEKRKPDQTAFYYEASTVSSFNLFQYGFYTTVCFLHSLSLMVMLNKT